MSVSFCPVSVPIGTKKSDLCLQIAFFQSFGRQVGFEPTIVGFTDFAYFRFYNLQKVNKLYFQTKLIFNAFCLISVSVQNYKNN